ncbi:MAG TPA: hypothetical protein VKV19_01765 [Ktedonobacteraceae bacterium]|nr:hypothetical protein [Ktedonobacteraceae bacterium]
MPNTANLRSVRWENEDAFRPDGTTEKVTVVLWDYDARVGKALTACGQVVNVYLTDYALADLTIGEKPQEQE